MTDKPETSIIIRTKNEERWLETVLTELYKQTYQDFEILIIDSGSIDKTLEIASKFPVKIFHIDPQDFSYPYSLNFGCQKASATKYLCFIPGHSLPITKTWLEDGIENFKNPKVCGVYGLLTALPDGTFWDKLFMAVWDFVYRLNYPSRRIHTKIYLGLLGFTNGMIRKELWDKHPFDLNYGAGGEEAIWADYWFKSGYIVIQDVNFSVKHSHHLGLIGWIKQLIEWRSLKKPKPFRPLKFRKNLTHEEIPSKLTS